MVQFALGVSNVSGVSPQTTVGRDQEEDPPAAAGGGSRRERRHSVSRVTWRWKAGVGVRCHQTRLRPTSSPPARLAPAVKDQGPTVEELAQCAPSLMFLLNLLERLAKPLASACTARSRLWRGSPAALEKIFCQAPTYPRKRTVLLTWRARAPTTSALHVMNVDQARDGSEGRTEPSLPRGRETASTPSYWRGSPPGSC